VYFTLINNESTNMDGKRLVICSEYIKTEKNKLSYEKQNIYGGHKNAKNEHENINYEMNFLHQHLSSSCLLVLSVTIDLLKGTKPLQSKE
jgi:hypothetical protein